MHKETQLSNNYRNTKFRNFKYTTFAVKAEAILENCERKIDTILKMTTLYLNVKYIKTGSRILTYDTSIKFAGV